MKLYARTGNSSNDPSKKNDPPRAPPHRSNSPTQEATKIRIRGGGGHRGEAGTSKSPHKHVSPGESPFKSPFSTPPKGYFTSGSSVSSLSFKSPKKESSSRKRGKDAFLSGKPFRKSTPKSTKPARQKSAPSKLDATKIKKPRRKAPKTDPKAHSLAAFKGGSQIDSSQIGGSMTGGSFTSSKGPLPVPPVKLLQKQQQANSLSPGEKARPPRRSASHSKFTFEVETPRPQSLHQQQLQQHQRKGAFSRKGSKNSLHSVTSSVSKTIQSAGKHSYEVMRHNPEGLAGILGAGAVVGGVATGQAHVTLAGTALALGSGAGGLGRWVRGKNQSGEKAQSQQGASQWGGIPALQGLQAPVKGGQKGDQSPQSPQGSEKSFGRTNKATEGPPSEKSWPSSPGASGLQTPQESPRNSARDLEGLLLDVYNERRGLGIEHDTFDTALLARALDINPVPRLMQRDINDSLLEDRSIDDMMLLARALEYYNIPLLADRNIENPLLERGTDGTVLLGREIDGMPNLSNREVDNTVLETRAFGQEDNFDNEFF